MVPLVLALLVLAPAAGAGAGPQVGTSFPPDFPVIVDASLGVPVIGFGAAGPVRRTPVIFLHGNNDTPFATACNPFGYIHNMAQFFADNGYALSELWGLGYQGEQCDLIAQPTNRSGGAHTTVANVPDLRKFVAAVLAYTGARQVDIVGHSLGVTLARTWLRTDEAFRLVRRFVAIDGPNHGIINCSPSPANFYQLPAFGGFTPDSSLCLEYGADDTPVVLFMNDGNHEATPPTQYLVIRNADRSFVYFPVQDGVFPPVPAQDREGSPHDFSLSARIEGAREVNLTGQGEFDAILGSSHLGILNSPAAWQAGFDFLTQVGPR
ncbi:MAG TPA: alpha/beta fold hydrolase [Methylomirabilota bacterium]|nr:alpha/beta fold hydrolase [Methylomirabilota bacterium]